MFVESLSRRRVTAVLDAVFCMIVCLSVSAQGVQDLFGPDSDVITHPYLNEYRPGLEKRLVGYGEEAGQIRIERVEGRETHAEVRCLVCYWAEVTEDGQPEEWERHWLAQDKSGNIRILKKEGYDPWDEVRWSEDLLGDPPVFIPVELAVGTTVGMPYTDETEVVAEVGVTVPKNEFGMGPYENCVVIEWSYKEDIDFEYHAPGIGLVWDQWDDEGPGGYRIAEVKFLDGAPTPTPTPIPLPPSDLFGPDSGVITHPYFSEYRPGLEKKSVGYGEEAGDIEIERVEGPETYQGIRCLVWYWAAAREDGQVEIWVRSWMAQDKSGNIRVLKEEGYDPWDEVRWSEDRLSDPPIFIPAELAVGATVGVPYPDETEVIAELGVTVPKNEFGLGPYENCVIFRWSNDRYVDHEYYAPGIGLVWVEYVEGDTGGFRIAELKLADGPPAPTPRPDETPSLTPWKVFTLDSEDEFQRYPGGFIDAIPGEVSIGPIPPDPEGLSDGRGASIATAPDQVELLLFPTLDVSENVVLIRASVQSVGAGAAVALAVLDGSMDGSIATNVPANSGVFQDKYERMVLVYDPPGTTITPVFQVANLSGTENVLVYLDNLEIYLVPKGIGILFDLLYGE